MTIINNKTIEKSNIIHCHIGIPSHIFIPNAPLNEEDNNAKNNIFIPKDIATAINIITIYGVKIKNVTFQFEYPNVFNVEISGITESAISFIDKTIKTIEINDAKNANA